MSRNPTFSPGPGEDRQNYSGGSAQTERVIYVKGGGEHHWQRTAMAVAGIGLMAIIGEKFVEAKFNSVMDFFGHPATAVKKAADAVQDAGADTIHAVKQAGDDFAAEVNPRKAWPLVVDPEDVVKGKIDGKVAFGKSNRKYTIVEAQKTYDAKLWFSDEFIELNGGVFMASAYVPGPLSFEIKGKTIQIVLPAAVVDPAAMITAPHDTDDRQVIAAVGQLFGSSTSREEAMKELVAFVNQQVDGDRKLRDVASCFASESVRQVIDAAIVESGLVIQDPNNPEAGGYQTDVITFSASDGKMGPPPPMTKEFCDNLIAESKTPDSGLQPVPLTLDSSLDLQPTTVDSVDLNKVKIKEGAK